MDRAAREAMKGQGHEHAIDVHSGATLARLGERFSGWRRCEHRPRGGTDLAKESLSWLAVPSAGLQECVGKKIPGGSTLAGFAEADLVRRRGYDGGLPLDTRRDARGQSCLLW